MMSDPSGRIYSMLNSPSTLGESHQQPRCSPPQCAVSLLVRHQQNRQVSSHHHQQQDHQCHGLRACYFFVLSFRLVVSLTRSPSTPSCCQLSKILTLRKKQVHRNCKTIKTDGHHIPCVPAESSILRPSAVTTTWSWPHCRFTAVRTWSMLAELSV